MQPVLRGKQGISLVPATSTRRNAKYLGIYKEKCVRAIGRIVKVVACNVNLDANTVTVLPDEAETVTAVRNGAAGI
jgi:hypothetical protein